MGRATRAARALAHLPEADPALAALALWCAVADGAGPTRATGDAIIVGAEFEAYPLREQIGVLARCILAIALRHEARGGAIARRLGEAFDPKTFAAASTALLNECVIEAGHAPPRPAIRLSDLIADSAPASVGRDLAEWDLERLYFALKAMGNCGDGESDDPSSESGPNGASAIIDDAAPEQAASGAGEDDRVAADWRSRLTRALGASGAAGRGVGRVFAKAPPFAPTDTPWEMRLRRLLTVAASPYPRRSHRRPRRSWIAADAAARAHGALRPAFEPGEARDGLRPRIAVCLDTSGSIGDDPLSLFGAEIAGVARRTGAETHLICFDETVYDQREITADRWASELSAMTFRRDGGTCFVDALARADALSPSRIVVLTDLDGPFGERPRAAVLWATPLATWPSPPFGDVISLAR